MFTLFKKHPLKALQKKRFKLLEEAMLTQRSGNLRLFAEKMVEVENLEKEIATIERFTLEKAG